MCQENTYSAIGEEGVTLFYQNSFYHGRIGDTQHRLAAIKNAIKANNITVTWQKHQVTCVS